MYEWVMPVVSIIVGLMAGAVGSFVTTMVMTARLDERHKALKETVQTNDSKLWDQIGRDSFSGMRKIVHSVQGCPEAVTDLDRRVTRLESGPLGKR